jgi:hypothetical protein
MLHVVTERHGMLLAILALLGPKPAELPVPVRKVFAQASAECRKIDAGVLRIARAPAYVESVDLNGDGHPDYVADRAALVCSSAASLFCGTAGCGLDVLVSSPSGYRHSFVEARTYKVVRSQLVVTRQGDGCGTWRSGCSQTLRWTGVRFAVLRRTNR